ncbi:response regulator [Rheinheimera texasensis]|uniref:response regulator n=1 Tax=Rheinheimera texasensis TaxID=306205 RepID=UPI0032B2670C
MEQAFSRDIRILVIDEQALAQNYLKFALEKLGYSSVQLTDRASTALQLCQQQQFDLIILSFNLQQGKDGFQLYEELKTRKLQSHNTGFIFISAETDPSLVHSVIELQPDEFLAKPYTIGDLQSRIERVLKRKQDLRPLHQYLDTNRPEKALQELDLLLASPPSTKLIPTLLKFKGDLLLQSGRFRDAAQFYQSVQAVQPFGWAQIGLVRALFACEDFDAVGMMLERMSAKTDTKLVALEFQSELEFRNHSFDQAQIHLEQAVELAPRNLFRQQKLQQLSRLNHDYERQYKSARDLLKFARHSMYEQPDLYLNMARACIDFAVSMDEDGETNKLSKQATEALNQLRSNFPQSDTHEQQTVLQARLHYLKDQKDKALKILETMDEVPLNITSLEDALDRAKALHEVGLTQASKRWFEKIGEFCQSQNADPYLQTYLLQEQQERAELTTAPRELNNIAVMHYQHGNWQAALGAFEHAFRLLPRNAGIALNLLQSMLTAPTGAMDPVKRSRLQQACLRAIELGKLNPEQQRRFDQLKQKQLAV